MDRPLSTTATPGPDGATADIRPSRRISSTCVTCRVRKVRCDGWREVCGNCKRLGFSCTYQSEGGGGLEAAAAAAAATTGDAGFLRRRVRQACLNCHSRKARCSGTAPACHRCRAQGVECVYRPGKRWRGGGGGGGVAVGGHASSDRSRSHSPDAHGDVGSVTSPSNGGEPETGWGGAGGGGGVGDVAESVAMRTFDNFFRHVHHVPMFSFLHRASLMQRYHAGKLDRPLLLALVGITSLLTDLGPGMKEFGVRCIGEAEALVLKALDRPSTLRLQALVLVIKHRILCGEFSSAFVLHALASRFASVLRLNCENPNLCFLAREARRRLMWALYMIDAGVAGGHADFSLWACRVESLRIQLPCNERSFEYDLPETTEPLQPAAGPDGRLPPLSDDIGFLALHIRIYLMRSRILMYVRRVVAQPTAAELAALPARSAELAAELESFSARLPASFRWSEANVRLRAYSPRLCVFLMTHVLWEQCHCDLYRVALRGLKEALPAPALDQLEMHHPTFMAHCQRQVFEHARAMADMFSLMLTLDNGIPVTDLDLPVCLYQCARLLYFCHWARSVEFGITFDSMAKLAAACLEVLKRSIATPATIGIRTDLEELLANAASDACPPDPRTASAACQVGIEDAPVLSHHGLVEEVVRIEGEDMAPPLLRAPAEDAMGATEEYSGVETPMPMELSPDEAPTTRMYPVAEGPPGSKCTPVSNDTMEAPLSNAFEGALDRLDFGLEPLGMESSTWFASEWLQAAAIPQPDGLE